MSWVEKARRRGILTKVPAGSYGGEVVPQVAAPRALTHGLPKGHAAQPLRR